MKNFILFCITVMIIHGRPLHAESLDDWILAQVQNDEQLLSNAFSQTDGHSIDLLKYSRTYVPFFLEPPANYAFDSVSKAAFDAWFAEENRKGILPGGYIYRLRFDGASPLYAASAGNWEVETWYSIDLNKDLIVESASVWSGSGADYLYATMLTGVPPRLVVYDRQGEVKSEEVFDVNAADLEQRLKAAKQAYAEKGAPILEMLSLAEYLENPDASWREVDLSGRFNLRNQQQRDTERERLKSGLHLTRSAAIEALRSKLSSQEVQRPDASSESVPQAPGPIPSSQAEPTPLEEPLSSTRWLVAAVGVFTALGLLWVFLKKRK